MNELRGSVAAAKIKEEVCGILEEIAGRGNGHIPTAAIIRVGEKPDDISYERNAVKRISSFRMKAVSYAFPEDISEEDFTEEFRKINEAQDIDGILLLKPLPSHLDEKMYGDLIDPAKDLDGISPVNRARIFSGEPDGFAPCTAEAVMELLKAYDIPVSGARAVVVGRSMVVGRPLAMLLLAANATVTVCHTKTEDLAAVCREADILIAAAGKPAMIDGRYVKDGAVVVDVGVNVDENGNMCGDVRWDGLDKKASAATPVPGGVGSVTTAVLAKHLAKAGINACHVAAIPIE